MVIPINTLTDISITLTRVLPSIFGGVVSPYYWENYNLSAPIFSSEYVKYEPFPRIWLHPAYSTAFSD